MSVRANLAQSVFEVLGAATVPSTKVEVLSSNNLKSDRFGLCAATVLVRGAPVITQSVSNRVNAVLWRGPDAHGVGHLTAYRLAIMPLSALAVPGADSAALQSWCGRTNHSGT